MLLNLCTYYLQHQNVAQNEDIFIRYISLSRMSERCQLVQKLNFNPNFFHNYYIAAYHMM